MRRLSLLLAITLAALGSCSSARTPARPTAPPSSVADPGAAIFGSGTATIETGEATLSLDVEIAATTEAHRLGLMGRTELAPDAGMVFEFDEEGPRSFWMKDTLIPLSIAFFDDDGVIVSILDMEPCRVEDCPLYHSQGDASGALEVNRGWFADHGVRTGDRISFVQDGA